jgi:hypothetical protein
MSQSVPLSPPTFVTRPAANPLQAARRERAAELRFSGDLLAAIAGLVARGEVSFEGMSVLLTRIGHHVADARKRMSRGEGGAR